MTSTAAKASPSWLDRRPSRRCVVALVFALSALLAVGNPQHLAAAPDDQEQRLDPDEPEENEMFVNVNWLDQFDSVVFSNAGGVRAVRTRLDSRLKVQFEEIERACTLSDAQKQKLLLAAEGDIQR